MEESYQDPAPHRPPRPTRRPELSTCRTMGEEAPSVHQQVHTESQSSPREPRDTATTFLQKSPPVQNVTEKPWENVTLNRCLLVAITILVLSSGFQRLNETLRGQRTVEDEDDVALMWRQPGSLQHRRQNLELEHSLWDVMFWWLPDFDDDDDEDDDDGELTRRKTKPSGETGASSSLRNKPLPDKELMKHRDTTLKERRTKKRRKQEKEEPEEETEWREEVEEEEVPRKRRKHERIKVESKG